jgi:predicted DCC family thiol-disulfide oxidoreductase YuxK
MHAPAFRSPRIVHHPPTDRPLLIYDGDCSFCRRWIARWQRATGERVGYVESQHAAERFPEIPRTDFAQAVQWIELDGRVLSGADAVFRLFDFAGDGGKLPRLLSRLPGFLPIARIAYRFVATHRTFFSRFSVV